LKNQLQQENIYLQKEIEINRHYSEIFGQSNGIKEVLRRVEQVAQTDTSVLLQGETGTGKELIAEAIHRHSLRKNRIMVKVNCAALPPSIIESELFGREKGAYTGALTKGIGRFELADKSTLFLDEISELPLELQSKLLRVIEEGEFERLGSSKTIRVNVRIITATNRDLSKAIEIGDFREDLYYRLNVFPISIPPLRDRSVDIPQLVWAFVKELNASMGKRVESISKISMEELQHYSWPGNIRELRNVIERAMIICEGKILRVDVPGIPNSILYNHQKLIDVERNHILKILRKTEWRIYGKKGAAEILGLKPTTLYSRMNRLGITRPGNSIDI
jgi:transcriptional regulator with GAF, ATPase, and Fis domain